MGKSNDSEYLEFLRVLKAAVEISGRKLSDDALDFYCNSFVGRYVDATKAVRTFISKGRFPTIDDISAAMGERITLDIPASGRLLANKVWTAIGSIGGHRNPSDHSDYFLGHFTSDELAIVLSWDSWSNICNMVDTDRHYFIPQFAKFYESIRNSGFTERGRNALDEIKGEWQQRLIGSHEITAPSED